jgi:hypothetical protein
MSTSTPMPRAAQGISTGKAQAWILTAALVTAIVYAFRRLIEPATPSTKKGASKAAALLGAGPTPPLEQWSISYGAAFMMLSILALGAPELAASLALMGVTGNLLANGITIAADLDGLEGSTPTTPTALNPPSAAPAATGAAAAVAGVAAAGANAAESTTTTAAGVATTVNVGIGGFGF